MENSRKNSGNSLNKTASNKSKIRNSNIELLRIIAMLFIVFSHNTMFSGIDSLNMTFGLNKVFIDSSNLGKLGVAIFVMISGYYLSKAEFKISRVVSVYLQTLFYSITIFIIFCLADRNNFGIRNLIINVFPIMTSRYWFVTAYIILCLIMPFLNYLLCNVSRQHFRLLLLALAFWYSFAPTFLDFDALSYGGHLAYFILFYLVGAYARYYPENFLAKKKNSVVSILLLSLIMVLSVVSIDFLSQKISFLNGKSSLLYTVYSITVLLLAAFLLSFFVNAKPRYNKLINIIGECTFGVYLIHANKFVNSWVWSEFFNTKQYADSAFLIVYVLFGTLAVFVICSLIEFLRKNILDKYVFKRINSKIISVIQKAYEKVCGLLSK